MGAWWYWSVAGVCVAAGLAVDLLLDGPTMAFWRYVTRIEVRRWLGRDDRCRKQ